MATGLLLTAVCNFAFGASTDYHAALVAVGAQRLCARHGLAAVRARDGPLVQRIASAGSRSASGTRRTMSAAASPAGSRLGPSTTFGGWQYAFYVPGVRAPLIGVASILFCCDFATRRNPSACRRSKNTATITRAAHDERTDLERELTFNELFIDKVLLNKYVWLLAIANFFAYITRVQHARLGTDLPARSERRIAATMAAGAHGASSSAAFPRRFFFGWLSDRLGGRRGMVAALCMLPIIAAFAAIIVTPPGYLWFDFLMLVTIGFFIYPVINLIVIAALDIASKKAIGTAAGFIGLFGYIGRMVQAKGVRPHGRPIQRDASVPMALGTSCSTRFSSAPRSRPRCSP